MLLPNSKKNESAFKCSTFHVVVEIEKYSKNMKVHQLQLECNQL